MELTKAMKRESRDLIDLAYERALAAELSGLEAKFRAWRKSEITVFDLNDEIHKFHSGPSRDLFSFYNGSRGMEHVTVASAVAQGFLQRSELSPTLLRALEDQIEYIEENLKEAAGS